MYIIIYVSIAMIFFILGFEYNKYEINKLKKSKELWKSLFLRLEKGITNAIRDRKISENEYKEIRDKIVDIEMTDD